MRAKIKLIQEHVKNNQHASFYGRDKTKQIWLFEIGFEGKQNIFRFGSLKKEISHKIGDEVEYQIIKDDYISVKKIDAVFRGKEKPLVNHNAEIAIAATSIAIDLLRKELRVNLNKKEDSSEYFGTDTVKRASLKIANIMIEVQLSIDS